MKGIVICSVLVVCIVMCHGFSVVSGGVARGNVEDAEGADDDVNVSYKFDNSNDRLAYCRYLQEYSLHELQNVEAQSSRITNECVANECADVLAVCKTILMIERPEEFPEEVTGTEL